MSFLNSSGDIVLDAVLTDVGRMRLSKGDGSFRISMFALCDDEIDYSLYDLTQPSSMRDVKLLKTPIFEAVTDNSASMVSKLLSIGRADLLYLPVLKLNTVISPMCSSYGLVNTYVVCVDGETALEYGQTSTGTKVAGVLEGKTGYSGPPIRVDQGLDTDDISADVTLDPTLIETQYQVVINSQFASLTPSGTQQVLVSPTFVDDDLMATYSFGMSLNASQFVSINNANSSAIDQVIRGPRGTILSFRLKASVDLATSDYLFTRYGGTVSMTGKSGIAKQVYYLDTFVRVSGGVTGYSIDIPVRFIRLV